jgi:hypothetical protein
MWRKGQRWDRASRAARKAAGGVRRVVEQRAGRAWAKGCEVARKVVSIQEAARLDHKLKLRSAQLTLGERKGPEPSLEWLQGYAAVAEAALVPDAAPPEGPARPAWPRGPALDPERDDPEAGS